MLCRTGKDARHTCGRYAVIPDRTLREKLFGTTGAPQLELQVEEKSFPREVFDGSCTIVTASSSSLQRYKVPKSVTF